MGLWPIRLTVIGSGWSSCSSKKKTAETAIVEVVVVISLVVVIVEIEIEVVAFNYSGNSGS